MRFLFTKDFESRDTGINPWDDHDLADHGAIPYNTEHSGGAASMSYEDYKKLSDTDKILVSEGLYGFQEPSEEQKTQNRIERSGTTSKEMAEVVENSKRGIFLDPELTTRVVGILKEEPETIGKVIEARARFTRGDLEGYGGTLKPEKVSSDISFIN